MKGLLKPVGQVARDIIEVFGRRRLANERTGEDVRINGHEIRVGGESMAELEGGLAPDKALQIVLSGALDRPRREVGPVPKALPPEKRPIECRDGAVAQPEPYRWIEVDRIGRPH